MLSQVTAAKYSECFAMVSSGPSMVWSLANRVPNNAQLKGVTFPQWELLPPKFVSQIGGGIWT